MLPSLALRILLLRVSLVLSLKVLRENPNNKRFGFICVNGNSKVAIPWQWRCDGERDCPCGVDEKNCTYWNPRQIGKNRSTSVCDNGGLSYVTDLRCNSHADCADHADESDCPPRQCFPPEIQQFDACAGGDDVVANPYRRINLRSSCSKSYDGCVCVPLLWMCDGMIDAPDASDEAGNFCEEHFRDRRRYWRRKASAVFRCANGELIYAWLRSNNYLDCTDFSDEHRYRCYYPPYERPIPEINIFGFKWAWEGVDPTRKATTTTTTSKPKRKPIL